MYSNYAYMYDEVRTSATPQIIHASLAKSKILPPRYLSKGGSYLLVKRRWEEWVQVKKNKGWAAEGFGQGLE